MTEDRGQTTKDGGRHQITDYRLLATGYCLSSTASTRAGGVGSAHRLVTPHKNVKCVGLTP
jgi:hypothetical protein